MERPLRVLGLMSGTSVDAVDAALVDIGGSGGSLQVALRAFHSTAMPPRLRERVLRACDPATGTTDLICELNVEVGEAFAQAALDAVAAAGLRPSDVDLIGSHGQTVWHQGAPGPGNIVSTLQLGEPSVIAERTGITTVADFRPRDLAAGGQGAPLVSYVDWALYRDESAGRALQNIGGIANVTVLPAGCSPEEVWAFDTGPGNMLIDAVAQLASDGALPYDRDGLLAAAGKPDPALLAAILSHPYFALPPPRTTGREQFGMAYAERLWHDARAADVQPEDVVATCTLATARSIGEAYRRWVLPHSRLGATYVSGGGAHNPTLLAMLRRELPEVPVRLLGELGGDGQAKEALAFAVLAAETLRGVPTSLPGATGARHTAVLGKIVPGANWQTLRQTGLAQRQARSAFPSGDRAHIASPGQDHGGDGWGEVALGIDGGGTKTAAVATDQGGAVLVHAAAGAANVKAVGRAAALTALAAALRDLLVALPAGSGVVGLHAALAGMGQPEDEPPALDLLAEICALPDLAPMLGRLVPAGLSVSNDALAVLAAAEAEAGIVAVAGTGSLVWGRNQDGKTARAGGWGYLLGDEGSGFDLGRRGLAAVLAAHDGRGEPTALTAAALRHFDLQAPPELVGRIYGAANTQADIARFAPAVLRAAADDSVGRVLVRDTVNALADQIATVAQGLGFGDEPFPVICSGGLFRSDGFFTALAAALASFGDAQCRRLEHAPAEGAARLAWTAALARRRSVSA